MQLPLRIQPHAASKPNTLGRGIAGILIHVLAGLALPAAIWAIALKPTATEAFFVWTMATVCIANIVIWYTLAQLKQYARARQLSYVIPVSLIAFGAGIAVIGVLRAPFSIPLFAGCFLCTTVTSYMLTAKKRRVTSTHYIVPGGSVANLEGQPNFISVANIDEMDQLVSADLDHGAIVADLHFDHDAEWEKLFAKAALRGIPVYHARQMMEMQTGQVLIRHLSENELGSLIPNLPYMTAKRVADIVITIALSPILLLALAVIALAVRIDSKGSVFYIQERRGYRAHPFKMVKFRTMRERGPVTGELEKRQDAMTGDDDERVTRIGKFLRKYRLDELPQAWNILIGEMSWIGPRPEAIELSKWYEEKIPFYAYRHIVRPGITGWAQVNQGHVTDLQSVDAKLRFDFYYVKYISLWLDMLVAFKTIRVVLFGSGAR